MSTNFEFGKNNRHKDVIRRTGEKQNGAGIFWKFETAGAFNNDYKQLLTFTAQMP